MYISPDIIQLYDGANGRPDNGVVGKIICSRCTGLGLVVSLEKLMASFLKLFNLDSHVLSAISSSHFFMCLLSHGIWFPCSLPVSFPPFFCSHLLCFLFLLLTLFPSSKDARVIPAVCLLSKLYTLLLGAAVATQLGNETEREWNSK